MPQTIETTVYQYAELSDDAKESARQWYRDIGSVDFDTEFLFDDFERAATILGIEFKTRPVELMNGKTRHAPCIYYSGFWSQGDGASFEGRYEYAKGCVKAIRAYAPQDETLHAIARDLVAAQKPYFYKLWAKVEQSGHYNHSGTMQAEVWHKDDDREVEWEFIQRAMRDFADWMYKQLEAEYEYRTSDEAVAESIEANEYTFTENGTRFG